MPYHQGCEAQQDARWNAEKPKSKDQRYSVKPQNWQTNLIWVSFIGDVEEADAQRLNLWIEHALNQSLNLRLGQPVSLLRLQLQQDLLHLIV